MIKTNLSNLKVTKSLFKEIQTDFKLFTEENFKYYFIVNFYDP